MSEIPIEQDSGLELLLQKLRRKPKGTFSISLIIMFLALTGMLVIRMDTYVYGRGVFRYNNQAHPTGSAKQTNHERQTTLCLKQQRLNSPHQQQMAGRNGKPLINPAPELSLEFFVSARDVNFLYKSMPVSVYVDAFDYQQWGIWHAVIDSIADDYQLRNHRAVFRIMCKLDSAEATEKWPLREGMTARVHIKTAEKTLSEILFSSSGLSFHPRLKKASQIPASVTQ